MLLLHRIPFVLIFMFTVIKKKTVHVKKEIGKK